MRQGLPGEDAQQLMAPQHRPRYTADTINSNAYRPSAVLVLLCEDTDENIFIPLIERMTYSGAHSAQISLPGGKYDKEDADLQQTAIRECYEEIGIKDIEVLWPLTRMHIPVSSFLVHPFIGFCTLKDPVMKIHEREVKSLLKLSLPELLNENTVKQGVIDINEQLKIQTPWFDVHGHRVWGATAMILSEVKELLKLTS